MGLSDAELKEAANKQGVLMSCPGTLQGQTGWYSSNDMYFYFCLDGGEYLLLCGPLSKEMYDIAEAESKQVMSYIHVYNQSFM